MIFQLLSKILWWPFDSRTMLLWLKSIRVSVVTRRNGNPMSARDKDKKELDAHWDLFLHQPAWPGGGKSRTNRSSQKYGSIVLSKSLSKIIFPLGENFQHSIHQVQLEFSQTFVLAQSSEEKPSFIKILERMAKTFFAWVFLNEIFCSTGNCLKWTLQAKLEYIRQNVI